MIDYSARVDALRRKMGDTGIDGLLVTHPTNRRYLTGFTADDTPPNESSGHLLITASSAVLVTGSVNVTQAEAQSPHIEVVTREQSWSTHDAEQIKAASVTKLGYEPDAMLVSVFHGIQNKLAEAEQQVEWIPSGGFVDELRAVKSEAEIELLRQAFDITCAAFNAVAPAIAAGTTEREVAWRLHEEMVKRGAEGPAFPTIVAAGENAARPHHEPGGRPIQPGEPIVIDMGARFEGYCADLTRTVWVDAPDDRLTELYPIVEGAVETVFEHLHPGVTGKDLDSFARDHISDAGHGDAFSHGLGHGVGLRVHEAPSASKRSEDTLQPGHLLTIEPGVYYPEWGGIRIEDVVLVTDDGFEILTAAATKWKIDS